MGAARGSKLPVGQSALPLLCGGRPGGGTGSPARAEAEMAGVLGTRSGDRRGRGQRPRRDSGAPGGRPRDQGGDPAPQAGAHRARRDPGEAAGSRPVGSCSLDAWTPGLLSSAQHTGRLLSGSPPRGSHLRDCSRSSRRTRRWGREAGPEVGGEAWRPRAGSAAASTTRGRRDTLRLCPTRQETFRPKARED